MKRYIAILLGLLVMSATTAQALDVGVLGSYWNQKDGDEALGFGVLLLPATLPLEFRGTFYERSSAQNLRASPLDFGLAIALTRAREVRATAVAGGSYYFLDARGSTSDNEFGWYAGGRLELPVPGGTSVFGEVLYRGADIDTPNVNLSGVTFNIGLLF